MSDIKGLEIHDVFGLSGPTTKLVETISQAIGEWYKPIGVKRMAKAKAFELQAIGEALNDNMNLPVEYSAGNITISTKDFEELSKRTGNRLFYQELRKQQNIEAIVELAGDELKKEETVSSEPVDPDWTIRFFNSVEDVSNEEMQILWSKVLAGEVKQPKSFSIRTLEKLKNISQTEALIFKKLASCCFFDSDEAVLPSAMSILKKHGIDSRERFTMVDCGLLDSSSGQVNLYTHNDDSLYIHNRDIVGLFVVKNGVKSEIILEVKRLTDSGMELFKIVNASPNNQCFIDYLIDTRDRYIGNSNTPISISAHKISSYSNCVITWQEEDELPPISN